MSQHSQLDLISDHSKEKLVEVPREVLEMTNLKMLFLEGNFLYKLPEGFFWKLPRLMWLDLRNNQLECLPRSIAYHQTLENLLLTNNNISRLPNELGLVATLKALQVSENPLIYPSRKIVAEGTKAIRNYLKAQYEILNPVEGMEKRKEIKSDKDEKINYVEESSSSEEQIDYIKKEERNEIYQRIIEDLKNNKASDPDALQPTLHVKKISKANVDERRQQEPVKIVHKISRDGSKISLKSCFNRVGVRSNINKMPDQNLREGWLNQLRILLTDQEKILQQERSAAPYATYEEFSKMPSREDLANRLNIFFKERELSKRGLEKRLNIEKLITDLVEQLKEMENTYTPSRSPRAEIEEAGKQIKTVSLRFQVTRITGTDLCSRTKR
ncbi:hypothetical protein NQ314_002779 [Rhamnusium bicolor]|uniref:Leucine-rich repeat-containing protein 27 n=1 Tax=Rhamnusium bicolor TaxID=1586634 RepID=A0AAV8ZNZ3_9CUCU|nr:hypothetical protein NQ314_002779 [Rhamnusium bicolor]